MQQKSSKSLFTALLLCFFFGAFGVHRFYVGKRGSAVAQLLLTISMVGVVISGPWALVDLVMILMAKFTDAKGDRLAE